MEHEVRRIDANRWLLQGAAGAFIMVHPPTPSRRNLFVAMSPCRDCGAPTAPSARSCPSCGILNPVLQWIALPDGAHLTAREPVQPGGAHAAAALPAPRPFIPPAPAAKKGDTFGADRLGSWALWALLFALLDATVVGGAIGGLIAGVIALPIGAMLPVRGDGRKIPVPWSIVMISAAIVILFGGIFFAAPAAP